MKELLLMELGKLSGFSIISTKKKKKQLLRLPSCFLQAKALQKKILSEPKLMFQMFIVSYYSSINQHGKSA